MRWNNFFDDLESQLEGELALEAEQHRVNEERLRFARLNLRDALLTAGAVHLPSARRPAVFVELTDVSSLRLRIITLGRDWFSAVQLDSSSERQIVIPFAGITGIRLSEGLPFLPPEHKPETAQLSERISLQFLCRDLARRRKHLTVCSGKSRISGVITRAGSDFLELTVTGPDYSGSMTVPEGYRIIPTSAVTFLEFS